MPAALSVMPWMRWHAAGIEARALHFVQLSVPFLTSSTTNHLLSGSTRLASGLAHFQPPVVGC